MTGLTNITLSQLQILLPAAGFLFMGVVALVFPARVTAQFDLPNLTLAGRNEVRAVYGGFGIAIGVLLLASLFMPGFRSGICLAVSVALAGMAGGRVLSALIDGKVAGYPLLYLFIEVAGAVMLTAAV
jgi:hypothetical protein